MENGSFAGDFSFKPPFIRGCSIAMFGYQRVRLFKAMQLVAGFLLLLVVEAQVFPPQILIWESRRKGRRHRTTWRSRKPHYFWSSAYCDDMVSGVVTIRNHSPKKKNMCMYVSIYTHIVIWKSYANVSLGFSRCIWTMGFRWFKTTIWLGCKPAFLDRFLSYLGIDRSNAKCNFCHALVIVGRQGFPWMTNPYHVSVNGA